MSVVTRSELTYTVYDIHEEHSAAQVIVMILQQEQAAEVQLLISELAVQPGVHAMR
jgi:hypothetical protein